MTFPRPCPVCGADNRPIAKLCDQCGASLTGALESPPTPESWLADLNRPRVIAGRMLNQAFSVTYRLSEHHLRPYGISPVQVRALSTVRLLAPPITPSILALHLALDSRTVSDLVTRLEQCGWLRRVRDLPDRRAVRLELTDDGEEILATAWTPWINSTEDVWNTVSIEALRPVLPVLQQVRDATLGKLGYRTEDIFTLGPDIERV